jgi:trimeric autotransporter adhesin
LLADGQPSLQAERLPQSIRLANLLAPSELGDFLALPGKAVGLPLTALGHDGQQGRVMSGRGGLSFRTGDFFTGKDVEHMRLTPEGKLGIGVENPQAKLEVAGLIRTSEGLVFPDGSVQTTAYVASGRSISERAGIQRAGQRPLAEDGNPAAPDAPTQSVTGSGTVNYLAKWTGSTTIGNSTLYDTGSNVGFGTTTPAALLSRSLTNAGTNTIVEIGRHERLVTGSVGASGVGLKDTYYVENGAGSSILTGEMTWGLHTVTAGAEFGRWSVGVPVSGVVRDIFEIDNSGRAILRRWGAPGSPLAGLGLQATMTVALRDATTGTVDNAGPRLMMKVQNSDLSLDKWIGSLGAIHRVATDSADLIFTARAGSGDISAVTERLRVVGATGNVGIGIINPANPLHVAPVQYNIGGASQSGTTITGTGTTFTAAMVGSLFVFADGTTRTITGFGSATSLTVAETGTIAFQAYTINYPGLNVSNAGNVGIGVTAPTTKLHVASAGSHAIFGYSTGGYGVFGQATGAGYGIVGTNTDLTNGTAGQFNGHVNVSNNLSVSGTKNFRIDHPLDPANKYLFHASIESSEVKNLYDGTVELDQNGEAVVQLPEWFEVLNRDFRYQLTCIGGYAQVYVAEEIANHQFKIAGGWAGLKVSWQVTGNRQDPMIKAHPMQVEQEKLERERGHYLHPELYGQPEEKGVEWVRNPESMRQLKQQREKAEKEKKSN